MDKVQELVARSEIGDVLCRYSRGVDRRDWALVKDCFHPDATDQHGEFVGGPDAFIDWVSRRHASIPFSMHFLGNCLIEFQSADIAVVETYFIAIQRRESAPGAPDAKPDGTDYEVFARYCDRFERRHGAWRIAARQVAYDSTSTRPSTSALRELVGVVGRRDERDPIYELKRTGPGTATPCSAASGSR